VRNLILIEGQWQEAADVAKAEAQNGQTGEGASEPRDRHG
jgi:hypothetical protein